LVAVFQSHTFFVTRSPFIHFRSIFVPVSVPVRIIVAVITKSSSLCVCGLSAVGCLDPGDRLSSGTWLERSKQDKHLALVRCVSSQESWQVTCQHGVWSLDNVGNCTTTRPQVEGLPLLLYSTTIKTTITTTILLGLPYIRMPLSAKILLDVLLQFWASRILRVLLSNSSHEITLTSACVIRCRGGLASWRTLGVLFNGYCWCYITTIGLRRNLQFKASYACTCICLPYNTASYSGVACLEI